MKRLTDTKVKNAKPALKTEEDLKKKPDGKYKDRKLFDGDGLYLLVTPSGGKLWRFKYHYGGAEKLLALGKYPDLSLKDARNHLGAARKLLAQNPSIDPSEQRKEEKAARADSFKAVSAEWFEAKQSKNALVTRERNQFILDKLSDRLGKESVSAISTLKTKAALLAIQKKHGVETARRAHGIAARVFEFAIANGIASVDPTSGLKGVLKDKDTKHRPALTKPKEVGELMRKIYSYNGQPQIGAALKLLALNFTRPSELRLGKWDEIDFAAATWTIPASRMKTRRKNPHEHLLPLSKQSVAILKKLHELTGGSEWVFPQLDTPKKPISENATNNGLAAMGYTSDQHRSHSFRVTASTMLHELNFPTEVIDTQQARPRGSVSGIYNRSHLLPQRRELLQAWADYLDSLRTGANVVPIKGSQTSFA